MDAFSPVQTLHCKGRLLNLRQPILMGILNLTPDSFYDGGRLGNEGLILAQAEKMLLEGAHILDLGGASSRPGAATVSEEVELSRVIPALEAVLKAFPGAIVSIDTWRGAVAKAALDAGAAIINDISGGDLDPELWPIVAQSSAPYVLMHMQGNPATMQQSPHYEDVVQEVLDYFIQKLGKLRALGIKDIILDPGFGFGKTLEHNYALLRALPVFKQVLGLPVLVGISRKSMICKPLGISPDQALNGTTALHMVALQQGADILRVHDVKEAKEVVILSSNLSNTF